MVRRLVMGIATAGLALAMSAGPVLAGQCPLLIKQLEDATGNRLDAAGNKAKDLIAEAKKLHEDGVKTKDAAKHAASVKKCQEAAKAVDLALKMK